MHGTVEFDETYIGGEEEGSKDRKIGKKALVTFTVKEVEGYIGRVLFRCIPNASENNLIPFIVDTVESGNIFKTDSWKEYFSIGEK